MTPTLNRFVRMLACYCRISASKSFDSVYSVKKTNNCGWIQRKDEVTLPSSHLLHSAFSEPLLGFYGHLSARQPAVRVQALYIPNSTFKTHTHCSVIRSKRCSRLLTPTLLFYLLIPLAVSSQPSNQMFAPPRLTWNRKVRDLWVEWGMKPNV